MNELVPCVRHHVSFKTKFQVYFFTYASNEQKGLHTSSLRINENTLHQHS